MFGKTKNLLKRTAAVALLIVMMLSGCSLKRPAAQDPEAGSVPQNSTAAGETLKRRRASAAENSRINAASSDSVESAVKADENSFLGGWADSVSGRCYMDITVIQDEFLSIVIYWSDSAIDTVYWSLLGEYSEDTGEISYEGMQFRESFSPSGSEYTVMNSNVNGSLYMTADGILKWSERDSCRFEKNGNAKQPDTFVEMEEGEGYIRKTSDPSSETIMVLPKGAIVGVTLNGSDTYAVFGNIEGYLFYDGEMPESSAAEPPESEYVSEVYVFWGEDVADYLEDYDEYIADEDENAAIIVFAVENEVREFSLDTLEFTGFDDNDNIQFKITDSYMYGTLTSERELAVQLLLEGTLPNYGISYLDSNGVMRHQYITMSGEDGSILLIEWE